MQQQQTAFNGIQHKVTALIVFFSFVILIIAVMGICLVRNPVKGKCVPIMYGIVILCLGFIPMIAEGSAFLGFAEVSP
jgi:hypothetical protein